MSCELLLVLGRPCDWPDCAASANPYVSFRPTPSPFNRTNEEEVMCRYIGMDVHRSFAQLAIVEDGLCRDEGRIGVKPEDLREWAATLRSDDWVALEATANSDAIANLLRPLVGKVVVSNPRKTRAIAEAKVKTDKVDARILAQLLAADFLPESWVADDRTQLLRRLITRRYLMDVPLSGVLGPIMKEGTRPARFRTPNTC
jgi:Transposase